MNKDDGLSDSDFTPEEADRAAWEAARHTAEQTHQAMREKAAAKRTLRKDALRGALIGLAATGLYIYFTFYVVLPRTGSAQRSSCQSNLKQIVLAYKQYVTDWDELYPPLYSDSDGSGRFDSVVDQGWAQNIQPYSKSVKLLQCPSEANPANLAGGPQAGYTDYFMNGRMANMSESTITHIANTVLLGDHSSCNPSCSVAATAELDATATVRHLEGANYGFADGHVKWLKPGVLTDAPVTTKNYSFQPK